MKFRTPYYTWQYYKFGSISLCMIMRDAAKTLERCLNSVKGLYHELIIVDTGSKDNSIQIAQSYGARIYHDAWQDDFARPRNIGLEKATKDWILIMDPDEIILTSDHQAIRWMTRAKNVVAWWMTTKNYGAGVTDPGYHAIPRGSDPLGIASGYMPSTKTRLFRNGLGIKFKGCWHELVDWYLMANKMPTAQSEVFVHHWNHEITQSNMREKIFFSLKMGEKKVREWPENGQCWWELGVAEAIIGYRQRAACSFARAFELGFGEQSQFFTLARILNLLSNKPLADLAFEKGVCRLYANLTHIDVTKRTIKPLIEPILHGELKT